MVYNFTKLRGNNPLHLAMVFCFVLFVSDDIFFLKIHVSIWFHLSSSWNLHLAFWVVQVYWQYSINTVSKITFIFLNLKPISPNLPFDFVNANSPVRKPRLHLESLSLLRPPHRSLECYHDPLPQIQVCLHFPFRLMQPNCSI